MPAYLVSLPVGVGRTLQDNADAVICMATDAANAKAIAKAAFGVDANNPWDNATVTTIAAGANYIGFRFVIKVTSATGVVVWSLDYTAVDAAMDTIGAAISTALNLQLAGTTYTAGTNVLLFAAAAKGDHSIDYKVYLPGSTNQDFPIPEFVGTLVHNGAAGSALSVVMAEPSVIPAIFGKAKLVA